MIEWADNTVSLCEMKYAGGDFEMKEGERDNICRRAESLSAAFKGRRAIQTVLVTPNGIVRNKYAGTMQQVVTTDRLFVPAGFC